LRLHRIDPEPSPIVRRACEQDEVVAQTVQANLALYARKGFAPPWVGYLAERDERFVGSCGFAGPPVNGEAEIAYFTFPGNEGKGIATEMAETLIREVRLGMDSHALVAHTLPEEGASPTILRKLGFECLGVMAHPEDGSVWKWRSRAPRPRREA